MSNKDDMFHRLLLLLPLLMATACLPSLSPRPYDEKQDRAETAKRLGHPTRKTREELETAIQTHTKTYEPTGRTEDGRLESPKEFVFEGAAGTCYTVVMRLGEGSAWGGGAEAGLSFLYYEQGVKHVLGGPGLTGPGAVVSVGCPETTGPISMKMAPAIGSDPIGSGPFKLELFRHAMTREEIARMAAARQAEDADRAQFNEEEARKRRAQELEAAQSAARAQQSADTACTRCSARYQGCIGAGNTQASCRTSFDRCVKDNVNFDYRSACTAE